VLVGVAGLVLLRPGEGVEAGLDDAEPCPLVALGREGELDEDGVARHRCLALGVSPPERELPRRVDRLHDDGDGGGFDGCPVLEQSVPSPPGRRSSWTRSANHCAIWSGSVIVRQTTSAGASMRMSRSMVRSVIVLNPSC
jgi:hypothetical protein